MTRDPREGPNIALDELPRILREAPLPVVPDGWAEIVMARSRRRTRISVLAAGTAAGLVAVGVAFASHQTTATSVPATTGSSATQITASPSTSTSASMPSPTPSSVHPTATPSSSSSWPTYATAPPAKVVRVALGGSVELPSGTSLVVRQTSLCFVDRGESVNGPDLNCAHVRNGNLATGSFDEWTSGNRTFIVTYGIGDARPHQISLQLRDGSYVPVTMIHPIGDTWTGYFAISPVPDLSGIEASLAEPSLSPSVRASLLREEMTPSTIRVYDSKGHLVERFPPAEGPSASP